MDTLCDEFTCKVHKSKPPCGLVLAKRCVRRILEVAHKLAFSLIMVKEGHRSDSHRSLVNCFSRSAIMHFVYDDQSKNGCVDGAQWKSKVHCLPNLLRLTSPSSDSRGSVLRI